MIVNYELDNIMIDSIDIGKRSYYLLIIIIITIDTTDIDRDWYQVSRIKYQVSSIKLNDFP